jgi:ribosomal protein S18 acetylase RimI-like enzyme
MIEEAKPTSAAQLASIHKKSISEGFLSTLNINFLTALYKYIITKELVIISTDENVINGFVSYSYKSQGIIKRFIFSHPYALFWLFVSFLRRPSIIKDIFETMKAPDKSKGKIDSDIEIPEGELLSIAVNNNCQKEGMGTHLLLKLEEVLSSKNIKLYKVVAGESLTGANKFYMKNGFRLAKKINIHGSSISNVYVKELNQRSS